MEDIGQLWTQRCDALEKRIAQLELKLRDRDSLFATLKRNTDQIERSIAWLEAKALRPEDRPTKAFRDANKEALQRLATIEADARLRQGRDRSLAGIEARCADLEAQFAELIQERDAAQAAAETAMSRLDILEAKCLRPNERSDFLPLRLRGIGNAPGDTVPGVHVGQT